MKLKIILFAVKFTKFGLFGLLAYIDRVLALSYILYIFLRFYEERIIICITYFMIPCFYEERRIIYLIGPLANETYIIVLFL